MNGIRIEQAGDADRDWAARLMASSEPWTRLQLTYEALRTACERPGSVVHIACRGDQRVGFVVLWRHGVASAPYIQSIGVAPEARGIFICVSSFNGPARALYERHGYVVVAELHGHVIDDASELLMRKRLAGVPP